MSLVRRIRSSVLDAAETVTRETLRRPIPSPRVAAAALFGHDAALRRAVDGRTVVVTGSSSGIGEATAQMLASAGATVVLVARRREELERVAQTIAAVGGIAEVEPCDLSDRAAVASLGARLAAREAPVDILINNAGRSIRRPVLQTVDRLHDLERTMEINYYAPVSLMLALLPGMVERRSGQVINISTWGTRVMAPMFASYTASKAALDLFARNTDFEVRLDGVAVSSVHMPLVRTPMIAPSQDSYRGMPSLSSEDAAGLIAYAIISRSARIEPAIVTVGHLMDSVSSGLTSTLLESVQRRGLLPLRAGTQNGNAE